MPEMAGIQDFLKAVFLATLGLTAPKHTCVNLSEVRKSARAEAINFLGLDHL
jgi:hypothetical protein